MRVPYAEKVVLVGLLGLAVALGDTACKPGTSGGGESTGGDSGGTGRTCQLVAKAAGDGYDISATHTGKFPDGTVLTGHANYRSSMADGWDRYTPDDFTVAMNGAAHYAGTITHNGETMHLESALGTLDPNPASGSDVRTSCGTVTIG